MKEKTDHIYSTALAYACYKSVPKKVDEHLLRNMLLVEWFNKSEDEIIDDIKLHTEE